jgi:hypothetical protein
MTQCQHCAAKAHNAFLCPRCVTTLQTTLKDLPWWLDRLTESAIGHTRLGDGGRRSEPDGLVRYTDATEGDERLERDVSQGRLSLDRALAAGGVNAKASRLLDEIGNMLTTWVRHLCEQRGIAIPGAERNGDGPKLHSGNSYRAASRWLLQNVSAIAADEGAGECLRDITEALVRIEHAVNRPIPPRFIGPCPGADPEDDRRQCTTRLSARREAIEVTCRRCKSTHNVETLIKRLLADVDHWRFSRDEVLLIMDTLDERVPSRTFRRWRAEGKVKPSGFRNGTRITISRHGEDDEPLYRLSDVRKMRNRDTDAVSA